MLNILGSDWVVESSIGHIRDLPPSASEIPKKYKGEKWARLGIDVNNDFAPLYVIPAEKKKQVTTLKKKLKNASELFLATDEDREGEAIAWHLIEVLKPDIPVKRLVFHEITGSAIGNALAEPRDIDARMVDAQETRRILDRLVGYEVSPVLWKKLRPKLSAGRVQSVATRLIVAREEARMRFVESAYFGIEATLNGEADRSPLAGRQASDRLCGVDSKPTVVRRRLPGCLSFRPEGLELLRRGERVIGLACGDQRRGEAPSVAADLPLNDEGLAVGKEKLDGILNRDDVTTPSCCR